MLFIDYSSAFKTVLPHKLTSKLQNLGLNSTLCDWLSDFLTGRPQSVRIGNITSNSLVMNCYPARMVPWCVTSHKDNTILKFADDTRVIGLITGGVKMTLGGKYGDMV